MIHRYATNIRFAGALPAPVSNPGRLPRMPCLPVSLWWLLKTKVSWRNIAITPTTLPDARFPVVGEFA